MKSELKGPSPTRFEVIAGSQSVVEHAEATPNVEGTYGSEQGCWVYFPPDNSLFEWTYTIDLDRDAFNSRFVGSFSLEQYPNGDGLNIWTSMKTIVER
jgi:hypothetical protein